MKNIVLLVLIFSLVVLTACDPNSYIYDCDTLKTNVELIELINYDNADADQLFEARKKVKPFDFSKSYLISTLPKEENDEFLLEFSEIEFMLVWKHMDSPVGKSLKINYTDGSFDIICLEAQFSCQYDCYGNVDFFIGSGGGQALETLVKHYFGE